MTVTVFRIIWPADADCLDLFDNGGGKNQMGRVVASDPTTRWAGSR